MEGSYLIIIGMFMIFAGLVLILAAGFFRAGAPGDDDGHVYHSHADDSGTFSQKPGSEVGTFQVGDRSEIRGGGIIMLGPIPIIIGSDSKSARNLIILAIILMILYFLLF